MNKLILNLLFLFNVNLYAQVGINTTDPKVTLDVKPSSSFNPLNIDGVIIPRVKKLNTTDYKEKGLLVFYETEDQSTVAIERGFYYWDGVKWIQFFSMNQESTNRTIIYANLKNTFEENIDYSHLTSDSDIRNLGFVAGSIKPIAMTDNFTINSNNELVIGKTGYYDITGIISLYVEANALVRRDSFEIMLLVNDLETEIKSAYGFPNAGNTYELRSSVNLSGALLLNQNDRLKIKLNRYNKGNLIGSGTTKTGIDKTDNSSSLTLRYLGSF